MKKLWNLFSDYFGETILHPQFIINSYLKQAREEAFKNVYGQLLDIGCGRMPYKNFFLKKVQSYTGLDHPEVSKLYRGQEKPDILADVHKLPFKRNSYDSIISFEVLEYLENPAKALSEMNRILKPKGILILTVPFLYPIHDAPHDRYRFTDTSLKQLLEQNNFKIKKIQMRGGFWQTWFQNLLVYLFKSLLARPVLVIFLPFIEVLVVILNLLSIVLTRFTKTIISDYPLTTFVIAQKK